MLAVEHPPTPTPHIVDAIGGVLCNGCHKPLLKVAFDVSARPKIVMWIRCPHSIGRGLGQCNHYNVVDFEVIVLV